MLIFSTFYSSNKSKNTSKTYVTIELLVLKLRHSIRIFFENDVTCDPKYMLSAIKLVGKALREKIHWVSMKDEIYIIIYNTGGHEKTMQSKIIRKT